MIIKHDKKLYVVVDRTMEFYYCKRLTKSKKLYNRFKDVLYHIPRKEEIEIVEKGVTNID